MFSSGVGGARCDETGGVHRAMVDCRADRLKPQWGAKEFSTKRSNLDTSGLLKLNATL